MAISEETKHLRDVLAEALASLGKKKHFSESEIEALWRRVQKEL